MTATPLLFLIEDEEELREELELTLVDADFEVVVARDGEQAFAVLEADATRFKAIVTDIKMGKGPDGWEVGRRARELVPDMVVIYMSGDSGSTWSSKGVPNSVMLTKPFAGAQLVTAVSTLLNDASTHKSANPS